MTSPRCRERSGPFVTPQSQAMGAASSVLFRPVEVVQEFPEPWGIDKEYIAKKEGGQRHEKDHKVHADDACCQEDAISDAHRGTWNDGMMEYWSSGTVGRMIVSDIPVFQYSDFLHP